MLIYNSIKSQFLTSVENDSIAYEVEDSILHKMGRHTASSEFRSWKNSLEYMYKVLSDSEIPNDSGIAIEYNIPHTANRVDFIVTGYDENKKSNVIVIELKQWETLNAIPGVDALVETFTGGANRIVVHPSYQAWSYAKLLCDYNSTVQDNDIGIHPCAYLHNYERKNNDPIDEVQYQVYLVDSPAYTMGEVGKLRKFIKDFVKYGDNEKILYEIENGVIRPSKSLQNEIANMMSGNKAFYMIDDQKVAYEKILRIAIQCQRDNKKRTIIVKGGPGTGKTVVAINLLAELTQRGQVVHYASKNAAPRTVYKEKLKGTMRKTSIDNMFKGSGSYVDKDCNVIHTILADEAHRLTEKSDYFGNGFNQVYEIIHASLCSVFFIDENQRVTEDDIGTIDEIKKWANAEQSEIREMELVSQFRCNGSDGYMAWLDDILEIRETANYTLEGSNYDFKVVDNPNELRELIVKKNEENHNSRLLAGYCWEWKKSSQNNPNDKNIVIDDFAMSWNLRNYSSAYVLDDLSIDQVGCIHTSQGLELDYAGVIIGDDLRYENGQIVTDVLKRASTDVSVKSTRVKVRNGDESAKILADEIIKNTYRTLMTRGLKGCYVYCTNKDLSDYLKSRIK